MEWLVVPDTDVLDDMPSPGSWMDWAEIYDHPPFTKPAEESDTDATLSDYGERHRAGNNVLQSISGAVYYPWNQQSFPFLVSDETNQTDEEGYDSDIYSKKSILDEFVTITSQMTQDTRICFCDALYRLARKSEQYTTFDHSQTAEFPSTSSTQEGIPDKPVRSIHSKRDLEDSNLIDLTVADLLFLNQEEHCPTTSPDHQSQELTNVSQRVGTDTQPWNILTSQMLRRYPESNDFQVPVFSSELSY